MGEANIGLIGRFTESYYSLYGKIKIIKSGQKKEKSDRRKISYSFYQSCQVKITKQEK